jgi:hypothetical protein
LFGASVVTSGFAILANGIASAESFGAPTVTVGAAMIIPIGIVSGEAFGTAAIMLAVIVPPTGTIRGGSITGSVRRSGTAGTIRIPS